ncbi:hypothetical protein ACHAXS_001288 [Conticribra weissflogii]
MSGTVTNYDVAKNAADDEFDIDSIEKEEENVALIPASEEVGVKGVKENAIPVAVFKGLAA